MKITILLVLIVLGLALSACSTPLFAAPVETPAPTPTTPPTPSPSPSPAPVIAVFGAESSSSFTEGVTAAAKEGDYAAKFVSGGLQALAAYRPTGESVAIVYLTDPPSAMPKTDLPLYIFSAVGYGVSSLIPHLTYLPRGTEQAALDCAIAYPPHLTPVRMIGLFSSSTSEAYQIWTDAQAAGQVFAKREYIVSESEDALSDWMTDVFSRYFPGMLDAVYAETGELAIAAADKLASLGRDDVEVFSAGTDANAVHALSPILVCAVGIDLNAVGTRCYEEAAKLLSGQEAETDTLSPEIFWYSPNP